MAYSNVQWIEKGGNMLYVLASNDLYSYNEKDNSIQTFDKVNGLNDTYIEFIAWNNVAKCLVIAYSDQNIDLLTQKGEIISLSDYYRKTMTANKKTYNVPIGSTLYDVFGEVNLQMKYGPISAKVNNKVEGMHYRPYHNKDVEFLDLHSPSALRTYTRSLFFVLCKAIHDLYTGSEVIIDIPVSNGYYVDLRIGRPVETEDATRIRTRMQQIIDQRIPISRHETTTEAAIEMFKTKGDTAKVKLLETSGKLYTTYYQLDDYIDSYYGALLTNTSELYLFGLEKYFDGLLLRVPSLADPSQLGELITQNKMFEIFKEHHRWQNILGISTVGDFNKAVSNGFTTDMINVSEALQEKKIAQMADEIAARKNIRVVLLAGPSSSGKTTTCKRLSVQLLANGIKPVQISLDDYFVDRDKTPKDADGELDYESLYALNIPLLNQQFNALFRGEEVQLPNSIPLRE